jgi:hypothetical protein
MDPTANLQEQLMLSSRIIYQIENDRPVRLEDSHRLAELVVALDEWRRSGGFDPYTSPEA